MNYILKDRLAVPETDLMKWAVTFEKMDRHVAQDVIGDIRISTVFLGMDHGFSGAEQPLLFETMIFGGAHDQHQTRCSTWDEAEIQHTEAVEMVKKPTKVGE